MNYALITNGVVTNIIWLKPDNAGDFPGAVACGGKPVAIGDSYSDGKFWRGGVEVLDETGRRLATLEAAKAENAVLSAQILALTENSAFLEDCIAEMAAQVYA